MTGTVPTYWDYLKLDRLLNLQGGLDADESALMTDELHFIIVHQAFELWFKLTLGELRLARNQLAKSEVPEENIPHVVHHLGRVSKIFKLCVDQFEVMETLTPQDFLGFRDKLIPSSGFQSFQMRELEILLGLEDSERETLGGVHPLAHIEALSVRSPSGDFARGRINAARAGQTLRSALHEWLYRTPVQGSCPGDPGDEAAVQEFVDQYLAAMRSRNEATLVHFNQSVAGDGPKNRMAQAEQDAAHFLNATDLPASDRKRSQRIRAAVLFIEAYRKLPLLAWPRLLIDAVVELEEQLVLFRTRHARMVERLIGRRVGTGGSSGVDYLDKTTRYRVFTELWAVRTLLLPPSSLPPLRNGERYGFAAPTSTRTS